MTFCTYEDRTSDVIAVRLLAASLFRVHPEATLFLLGPGAASAPLPSTVPEAQIRRLPDLDIGARGWDVKPAALLHLLKSEANAVTWLDSDLIFTDRLPAHYANAPYDALIVAQEYRAARRQGSELRTTAWSLEPGHRLVHTVNSGIVGATRHHITLLETYRDMLAAPGYIAAQRIPFSDRPLHLAGDQDVLTALLGSKPYEGLDLVWLRAGRDIAQCQKADGFRVRERLRARLVQPPSIVHAQGMKPWRDHSPRPLQLDLSPYAAIAKRHEVDLDLGKPDWLYPRRLGFRVCHGLFRGDPYLRGIPTAVAAKGERVATKIFQRLRWRR
ncbi:hypothetical protein DLJ53_33715 [Acuticoccus sediminis]|uniref:Nucleotide-diphospho-sugar transferase n=2 Tax=Acuticoccus sediminis TaxID=2184697 RepID=A0A8B2NCH4_9HYPH|nr:hypothetical protein DLJ53_33715 [Acuticoccus sediminis]